MSRIPVNNSILEKTDKYCNATWEVISAFVDNTVEELKEEKGYNRKYIASNAGLDDRTLKSICSKDKTPSVQSLIKVLYFLGYRLQIVRIKNK